MPKRIFMIAGSNGSGKTTTAFSANPDLLNFYEFLNADEIARGLAPLYPESMQLTASKLLIQRLRELLKQSKNFAFETTAAGTNYVKYLQEVKEKKISKQMARPRIHQLLLEAHKRGVRLAEDISARTGVPLVVEKDGKIIEIPPKYQYVRVPIKTSKKDGGSQKNAG